MRTCNSCGARNTADATFCVRCGASFVDLGRDPADGTDAFLVTPERIPDTLVDQAATQLADGDAAAAIENCRRAVALNPRHVEAYAVLGMAFEQTGDLPDALDAYDTVLRLAPDRAVERQKAALLRLRLGHTPPPAPRRAHGESAFSRAVAWCQEQIRANPALAAGLGAAAVVLIIGSILLVHAGRVQAREQLQAQYDSEIQLARQALAAQQYAQATAHYQAAWQLLPGDRSVRDEWDQAYRLSQIAAAQYAREMEIAGAPKYIPNTTGRNPFEPVPIAGSTPAVPPPAATQPSAALTAPIPGTPPPTVNGGARPYTGWQQPTPSATTPTVPTPPSSRRTTTVGGNKIITPVTPPKPVEKPAAPAATDTSGKRGGEITIWMSPKQSSRPATPQATDTSAASDAATLRARGEQAGRAGRTDEAIGDLQRAASAYDDLARRDPNNAAAHSQAADTCRARIEILRQPNR
ncbi:tetratricopeptide repeat protein [bacterium]|nr:tetratricopeptide repeat protein [bacterium]